MQYFEKLNFYKEIFYTTKFFFIQKVNNPLKKMCKFSNFLDDNTNFTKNVDKFLICSQKFTKMSFVQ